MSRLARSMTLFKTALSVVSSNKRLLMFPVLAFFFTGLLGVAYLCMFAFWPTGAGVFESPHWEAVFARLVEVPAGEGAEFVPTVLGSIFFIGLYLLSMFAATFFNVAFYSQILNALKHRPVSFSAGIRVAVSRLGAIVLWSLFAGVVGIIISKLEQRFGFVGRWAMRAIGLAWSVASVFVVPMLVMSEEVKNPLKALKSSAKTLKQCWGESLAGYIGIQVGGFIVLLATVFAIGGGVMLGVYFDNFAIAGAVVGLGIVLFIGFSYLLSVASNVFRGALYLYATEGQASGTFTPEQMDLAWKHKKC